LALRYPADRLELMLVDNASADGSFQFIAARFPQVTVVNNPDNYGFARGNNEGARLARGQLVAFLNPDMRVEPNWLAELVASLQRDPSVVCAASKILSWNGQHIDFAGSSANFLGYGYQEGWGEPSRSQSSEKLILAPCGGAMMINRQVFLDSGGFDEDYFAFYEDLDLGWRLWLMGYQVAYVPRAVAYHVHHGSWDQVPNAKISVLYQRNAMSTLVKNYDDENLKRVLPCTLATCGGPTWCVWKLMSSFRSSRQPRRTCTPRYLILPLHQASQLLLPRRRRSMTAPTILVRHCDLAPGNPVSSGAKAAETSAVDRRRRVKLLPSYRIRPRPRPEQRL
jgi:GT2 family glycosyltransferase